MVCATSRSFNYELRSAAVGVAGVLDFTICAARDHVVFGHLESAQMETCCQDFRICILFAW
jgi:hypothetical protein